MSHVACGDAVSIETRNAPNMPVAGEPPAPMGVGGAGIGGTGSGLVDGGGAGSGAAGSAADTKYVASSVVFSPDGEQTYVIVLDSLSPQVVDYARAIELPGWADIWVHEGQLYVSSRESSTVTKYSVTETGELLEQGVLSFSSYGEVDVAF